MNKEIYESLEREQRLDVGRALNGYNAVVRAEAELEQARVAYRATLIRLRSSGVSIRELGLLLDKSAHHVQVATRGFHDPRYERVAAAAQRRGTEMRNRRRRKRVA